MQIEDELDELMPEPVAGHEHLGAEPEVSSPIHNNPEPENTDVAMLEIDSQPPMVEESGVNVPVPEAGEDELAVTARLSKVEQVFELSFDIHPEDITDNPLCLWNLFEECFQAAPPSKAKQRRVEVHFRKRNEHDEHDNSCFSKPCKKSGKVV